jgi:hypothetical protein
MKMILKLLIGFIVIIGFGYGMFSFIYFDLNPSSWGEMGRITMAVICTSTFACLSPAIIVFD